MNYKITLRLCLLIILLLSLEAQSQIQRNVNFAATAAYHNLSNRTETLDGNTVTDNLSGFALGVSMEMELAPNVNFKPELIYGRVSDANWVYFPLQIQYYPYDSFFLTGGPQLSFFVDEIVEGFRALGIDLKLGVGYDLNENFYIFSSYSLEITNRISNAIDLDSQRFNTFHFGVGYRFWFY